MLECDVTEKIKCVVSLNNELESLFTEPSFINSNGNNVNSCLVLAKLIGPTCPLCILLPA